MKDVKVSKREINTREQARIVNGQRHRRKRKRSYILYYILLMFFVIIAFVTLSITVFFNIKQFSVKGLKSINQNDIINTCGVKIEDNLLRLNISSIESKIIKNNFKIDDVAVKRKFPSTLEINVTEAVPFANVKNKDTYCVISKGGRIIRTGLDKPDSKILTIIGVDVHQTEIGNFIDMDKDEKFQTVKKICDAIQENKLKGVKSIDVSSVVDIYINYQNRVSIELGSVSEISYKLLFIKDVLENREAGTAKGTIDARNPGKIYFKPSLN